MDLLPGSPWHRGREWEAEDELKNGRPNKRLKTARRHASILQPITRLVRDPLETIGEIAESLGYPLRTPLSPEEEEKDLLLLRLRGAKSYDEWSDAAAALDRLEGGDAWKSEEECDEYDVELVKSRLAKLEQARVAGNLEEMHFHVRTALTRDLGGMGAVGLYRNCRIGTKALIERYIDTVVDVVETVVAASGHGPNAGLDARFMADQMKCTRQAFGRSALLLSGGGTLGMNHIGVVKCLLEAGLLPRIISGASAGSIVCAVLCTKLDEDIPAVLDEFCHGDLTVFESEGESLLSKAVRFMKQGAFYDVSNLTRIMRNLIGDMTFQEAYHRTQRILSICVSSADIHEMPKLLNYVTAPRVLIWSAVAASCSVPLVFRPAQLWAKDAETGEIKASDDTPGKWIDGSVDNDLPMTRLAEMLNVNHFIVSQVNPHVVPFLTKEDDEVDPDVPRDSSAIAPGPSWMHFMATWAKDEAIHRMHQAAELGILPTIMTKCRSVLGQKYAGDITIIPEISYTQIPRVLTNPTSDFMVQAMFNGERATWPKLSRIRHRLSIELALDKAVHTLLARVAFSPSQVDLRLNVFRRPNTTAHSERPGRRRGSKASHKSARSSIVPRPVPGRQSLHRPIRSEHDPPSVIPAAATLRIPGPEAGDYFSSTDDSRAERSSSPTPSSDHGGDDDTENILSDSTVDSPPSPEPSHSPWPAARRLFPSASQPATPSIASKRFPFGSSLRTRTPPPISASLSMTPSANAAPSSPEAKYKRLFFNTGVRPMPTIRSQSGTPDLGPSSEPAKLSRKFSGLRLNLDMSAGRMMMQKRRRRLSTGVDGLKPPKKQ